MNIVLWGATGQAIVLGELYARLNVPIVAVFDNDPNAVSPFAGVEIYHGTEGLRRWLARRDPVRAFRGLAAIGGDRGEERIAAGALLESAGVALTTAVHPAAFVALDAQIGKGSQILASASIGARARIGESCIVNTAAGVDHECVLEDGVHVAPGATLAGCVHVGRAAFIGTNATVLPRVRIGAGAVIGAGSVVLRDVPGGVTVAGNPARAIERS
jgi:sugar O-acyltransferase (sialic acid O-acetyltransferase NeuD family)